MRRLIAICVLVSLAGGIANAGVTVYSAKDTGLGEAVPLPAWPNSDAAAAAFLSGLNEFGAGQNGELRRHRVVGHAERAGDVAGGHSLATGADQESKDAQPTLLS